MKMNFKKGFTLIELLVVIAIIGILASVVLASLNSARAKGSDAAVKANLSGLRANAELQYDTAGGCYTSGAAGTCSSTVPVVDPETDCATTTAGSIFALTSIAQQLAAAKAAGGGFTSCSASVGGTKWAAVVQYKSSPTKAWCVDSTGKSKEVTVTNGTAQADLDAELTADACTE